MGKESKTTLRGRSAKTGQEGSEVIAGDSTVIVAPPSTSDRQIKLKIFSGKSKSFRKVSSVPVVFHRFHLSLTPK